MKKVKKLTLKKSTIMNLTNPEMGHLVGGGANSLPANTRDDNTCYGDCAGSWVCNTKMPAACVTLENPCQDIKSVHCTQFCEIDSYGYISCEC